MTCLEAKLDSTRTMKPVYVDISNITGTLSRQHGQLLKAALL